MNEIIEVAEAYNNGSIRFMGLDFLVAPGALVPRPETELLGTGAVDELLKLACLPPKVVDMCCGTGNLACALAVNVPSAIVWASDLTQECVDIARRNVDHHGLSSRVSVLQGNLFQAFAGLGLSGNVDLIVCNPPYISETLLNGSRSDLLKLEPREAFAAGPYGLDIHMRVAAAAPDYLRTGGILMFEVGLGQERQVKTLLQRSGAYEHIGVITDDAGQGRVVTARFKGLRLADP